MPTVSSVSPVSNPPWALGLRAARANVVPGLFVQALMLAILLSYYFHPPMRLWLDGLADFKARWSFGYTALSSITAGALVPELLQIFGFQKGRIRRKNFENILFNGLFWCFMGVVVDIFYRSQAVWFGAEVTLPVITKKVLVDQFLYNPLFASPMTAWVYDWKSRGFPCRGVSEFFTPAYYGRVIVPTLFATWGVWLPVVAIIYSLPSQLQIPLLGLALSMWVMMLTWMSEQRR